MAVLGRANSRRGEWLTLLMRLWQKNKAAGGMHHIPACWDSWCSAVVRLPAMLSTWQLLLGTALRVCCFAEGVFAGAVLLLGVQAARQRPEDLQGPWSATTGQVWQQCEHAPTAPATGPGGPSVGGSLPSLAVTSGYWPCR